MRTRTLALTVVVIFATLLSACTNLPSVMSPTATAPAAPSAETAPTVAAPAEPAASPTLLASTAGAPTAITATVSTPVTPTVPLTDTTAAPALMGTPVVAGTTPVSPTLGVAPERTVSTYSDATAGFAIDYPASWSVVDVAPEIKQQSSNYSVTFMSWKAQEPGGHGIPAGGSKIDLSVTKQGALKPETAVETGRQQVEASGSKILYEDAWELDGGLDGTYWTIQAPDGEMIHELLTSINGSLIVLSGMGDAGVFEQIAMTLRVDNSNRATNAAGEASAPATTPAAQAAAPSSDQAQKVQIPMVSAGGAPSAGAQGTDQAAAATTYTVHQGDTLAKIAAQFGVTVAAILKANPQIKNPDRITIGQRLVIPSAGSTPPAGTTRVNIYLIGEGGGSVGCGDQVVAVQRDVRKTAAPLTAALNLLVAQKSRNYGESGLYNALYQSNLSIASITRSGTAWTIRLTGTLKLGGVCDNPRVKAQLEQTALQFSTVKSVQYFVNGKPLDTLLSEK